MDVLEKNKKNAFSLGQTLLIDKEEFEDLEEIISRYIYPMAACARDLLNYKYYKDTDGGKLEKAEEIIREEKKKNPNKIHYIFSASAVSNSSNYMQYLIICILLIDFILSIETSWEISFIVPTSQ